MRTGATLGAAGPIIDQFSFVTSEVGTPDATTQNLQCRQYGTTGEKMPSVTGGANNGLSISVGPAGAGSLFSAGIVATIIVD